MQERSRRTLDAIMSAADKLFLSSGVANATLTEIAAEAGVAIGSLYRFFPNKDALVEEYLDRYLDELASQLTEPLPERPEMDQLGDILDTLLGRSAVVRRKFVGYSSARVWRNDNGDRPAARVTETELALVRTLIATSIYEIDDKLIERMTKVVVFSTYPILEMLPDVSLAEGDALVDEAKAMLSSYIRDRVDVTKLKKT